jgi:hypothetical protein
MLLELEEINTFQLLFHKDLMPLTGLSDALIPTSNPLNDQICG